MNTKAARLTAARKAHGWTQDDLATRAGVLTPCISKIECGQSRRPKCLAQLAAALGVSTVWLEYGDLEVVDPPLTYDGHRLAVALNRMSVDERAAFRAAFERLAAGSRTVTQHTRGRRSS